MRPQDHRASIVSGRTAFAADLNVAFRPWILRAAGVFLDRAMAEA